MSPIDYNLLRPDAEQSADPPDGVHDAILQRAAIASTRNGEAIVTEWTADPHYWWTAWYGFDPGRIKFTNEWLDAVGLDRGAIATAKSDDAFQAMLDGISGDRFRLKIERSKSGFLNTYVLASLSSRQQSLMDTEPDVPIDAPAPVTVPSDDDEDDIPF
jgi:hypothetical protein